jgi:hypothetical protein
LRELINEARQRLGLRGLSNEERLEHDRTRAIEDFKLYLQRRLTMATRAELLRAGEFVWQPSGAALRLRIEDHEFLLARSGDGCRLIDKNQGTEWGYLADGDEDFEDRLLAVIGDVVEAVPRD